jgi:anti-anti-sigma factor
MSSMSYAPLSIRSEVRGTAFHVAPSGELDIATAEQLERELRIAEQSDAETIVLDLSGLTFIDSTGLRVVLEFNERCGGEVDRLRVIAGSTPVERLLDIVGLRGRLPIITP